MTLKESCYSNVPGIGRLVSESRRVEEKLDGLLAGRKRQEMCILGPSAEVARDGLDLVPGLVGCQHESCPYKSSISIMSFIFSPWL